MILVESIKYFETEKDPHEIYHTQGPYSGIEVITAKGEEIVATNVLIELCHGRRFRRPSDNADVVIGWSEDVQRVLGMPFEAWENEEEFRNQLEKEINRFKNASFLTRLKWLFTGVKL